MEDRWGLEPPPAFRAPTHTFLRPFDKLVHEGDPNVGTIQFSAIEPPGAGPPRAFHATSILPPGTRARRSPLARS